MIVEATLADRHRGCGEERAQLRDVAGRVERRSVVRMDPGGSEDEPGIVSRNLGGNSRRRE